MSTRHKINLYLIAQSPLLIFLVILMLQVPTHAECIDWRQALKEYSAKNIPSIFCVVVLIYNACSYRNFNFILSGATEIPFEVTSLNDLSYEHLAFLASYVIPLISFDFQNLREVVIAGALLIMIGLIFVKTNMYYTNPVLALLGYRLYRANGKFKTGTRENIILVSRSDVALQQKLKYIKIDTNIYYVKEAK